MSLRTQVRTPQRTPVRTPVRTVTPSRPLKNKPSLPVVPYLHKTNNPGKTGRAG